MTLTRQHLIFDADDTLWESNRLFEQVTARFIAWLDHPTLDAAGVRDAIDDVALETMALHGASTRTFGLGLEETYRRLAPEVTATALEHIAELVEQLSWAQPQLIEGVPETLAALGDRHDLVLLTKGDDAEQHSKIDASGLGGHFRAAIVVPEKVPETYRSVVLEQELDPSRTWMVGNSPRFDIAPAIEAGLGAVYIRSKHTWVLEDAVVPDAADERLLTLRTMREMLSHF